MELAKQEANLMGRKAPDPIELLDMDRDENEASQSIKEKVVKILDEDIPVGITTINDADPNDDDAQGLIKGIDY